ncbi:nuclear transport factor 2 family protein [Cupriavidus consociatus]|uniref:nuclear transport factor 2 family protein n=1 Tax=Cupriavidus consociatus TaxID=2821357 RepID=UPI001AE8B260|nr:MULTISPECIES: nuclear transport factor 2 family protein [unclassified Cupriavidus]MBP0620854.1 nuclear transport factor 2 family protein [Cupriavidus sp. LEh25]MDK2657516.1 nuclear transport factor 2 family protein [Cupriavidus sp. LEh21]
MADSLSVVKAAYDAFGRGDVAAILDLVAEKVDWKLLGPSAIPYAGQRNDKHDVARFFAEVAQADDMQSFEPREFIQSGEHVTVLGFERFTCRPEGKLVETEWIHVFTVQGGKITRWRGCYDTAARFV